jgi:hypothetical protein
MSNKLEITVTKRKKNGIIAWIYKIMFSEVSQVLKMKKKEIKI